MDVVHHAGLPGVRYSHDAAWSDTQHAEPLSGISTGHAGFRASAGAPPVLEPPVAPPNVAAVPPPNEFAAAPPLADWPPVPSVAPPFDVVPGGVVVTPPHGRDEEAAAKKSRRPTHASYVGFVSRPTNKTVFVGMSRIR
jgi:hypothetical protein